MGFYSFLNSMLPHYDWWMWNVLEVLLRACGKLLSLFAMLMSGMLSDSGTGFAIFMANVMSLNFLLLTVALVIRHWTLGVITVSIPIALILLEGAYKCAFPGRSPLQRIDASNGTPLDPSSQSSENQVAMA
jgi:hypothetical protein